MNTVLFIILAVVVFLLVVIVLPQWRMRRAVSQVIRILRAHNAVDVKTAKTLDEMGIKRRGMLEGAFKGRDYKPYAVNALVNAGVIEVTENDRFYLSEEKLMASGLDRGATYPRY